MRGESALLYANEVGLDPPRITRPPGRRSVRGRRCVPAVGLWVLLSALPGAAEAQTALQPPLQAPQSQGEPIEPPADFTVGRFVVEGEDARYAAATERILAKLRDHPVKLEAIRAAAAQIQQLYVAAGHFLALVSLPSQDVPAGGEFRLQVIHRSIQVVNVDGIPKPYRDRVLAFMKPMLGRSSLTRAQFQRAILNASALPALNLKSTLETGATDDAVTLVLTGDYRAFSNVLSVDNAMPAIVGRNSVTLLSAYNPALRFVDQVSLAVSTAADADGLGARSPRRLLEAAVRTPIGISGAEIDYRYTWSAINPSALANPDQADNALLDTDSIYRRAAVHATYPLIKIHYTSLVASAGIDATALIQTANPYGSARFDDQLRVLHLGLALEQIFDPGTQLTLGADFSKGINGLGSRSPAQATPAAPLSQAGASNTFTKWEAHGTLHRDLPAKLAAELQVRAQYVADNPVLLTEKFTLGGPTDLSAYDYASFSGDRGWVARAELQHTVKWDRGGTTNATQSYLFAARGEIVNLGVIAAEPRTEVGAAAGLGLRASLGRASAHVGPVDLSGELARQFNPVSSGAPSHWRVNFSVSMHF
jgi:hemolysin activation/secretion protein